MVVLALKVAALVVGSSSSAMVIDIPPKVDSDM
jgi:hypothetical protein